MNRRGFIGTLTALAGVVLAKIKAPAKPISSFTVPVGTLKTPGDYLSVSYSGSFRHGIAGEPLYAGDMVIFKNGKIYRYPIEPLTGSDVKHFRAGYIPIDKP